MIITADSRSPSGKGSILRKIGFVIVILLLLPIFRIVVQKAGMTFGLLFLVILILLVIGYQGNRLRILMKMGLRNVNRRKVNTLIVVFGLMIGTAIISGSLVVGDTLENMFTKGVYDALDETDEIIFTFDANGSYAFFNYSEYENLNQYIESNSSIDKDVEGLSPEIHHGVSVLNIDTSLSEASVMLMGFDYSESKTFGKLTTLDGSEVTEEDLAPNEVYVNEMLADEIDVRGGHRIVIFSGENQSTFIVKHVVEDEGRAAYGQFFGPGGASGGMNIFMPLERVQTLINQTGKINLIKVSNTGDVREGIKRSDNTDEALTPYLYTRSPILLIFKIKQEYVGDAEEGSDSLQQLFMVLGAFSIIAGMMLIINIFVMLSEERKSEMGIARAVGMSQKHLMYMFLFEGTFYSFISAIVGTVVGLGVAYAIIAAFGSIFGGFNSLEFFTFTSESLILSFVGGMLITLLTIILASRKVSKINIIRAIRNIQEPRYSRHEITELHDQMTPFDRYKTIMHDQFLRNYELVIMGISAFLVFSSFVNIGIFFNKAWAGYGGLAGFIYGVGLLLRRYMLDEKAFTIAGGIVLLLWSYPYDIYDQLFRIEMEGDMEMFLLSGLFMISAALMVIMYNSNLILGGLLKIFGRFRSLAPIFKTAVSYPMDNRFRTGMTLAMFSLIIFTITVLSMIMGLISGNIDTITEENSGGYDMMAFNDPDRPITDIELEIDQNENLSLNDYEKIVPLNTAYTSMNIVPRSKNPQSMEEKRDALLSLPFKDFQENGTWYSLIGCSEKFFRNSDFQLSDWDEDEYENYEDVWKALEENSSLVIMDQSAKKREADHEEGPPQDDDFGLRVGDMLVIRNNLTGGHEKVVKVIGFTKSMLIRGAYVRADVLTEEDGFDTDSSYLTLLKFKKGTSEDRQDELAKDLEREFLRNGMQTFIIKKELESMLEMFTNFFYLLEAFLGLGLIVGIAGLGIITIRSVAERRQQIGMLRAIGFKRKMIWKSFLIETSYIALLGIFIGVALGIILGLRFWLDPNSGFEGDFIIPWSTIMAVSAIAYVFTFICTVGPSRGAAKVNPAEALRYIG